MAESIGCAKKLIYDDDSGVVSDLNALDQSQPSIPNILSSTLIHVTEPFAPDFELNLTIDKSNSNNGTVSNSDVPSSLDGIVTDDDRSKANHIQKPALMFHLLSDSIFGRIVDYLDYWTLLKLCIMDENFCRIIGETIVARDGLDIGRIKDQVDARHILRYLGGYATKLHISASDFKLIDPNVTHTTEMFRHIGRFCTNLKTLYAIVDMQPYGFKLTNWSGFKHIENFTIKADWDYGGWYEAKRPMDCVLKMIIPKCENLKSLTIHNIFTSFEYMLSIHLSCPLKSLRLRNSTINSKQNWFRFLDEHKLSLKTLEFNCSDVIDHHFNNVLLHAVQTIPNLRAVSAYPSPCYFGLGRCDTKTTTLLQFKNLNSMGVELNKYNMYILEMLAYRNVVRTVTIKFLDPDLILTSGILERLTRYTNLKCIRFVGNLWGKCCTVRQILNALPGLIECHFCDVLSFDFNILLMIRSPLLECIVFENERKIKIFKYSFKHLNEQRAMICPNAPSLKIYVDTAMLAKAKAKLGTLIGSHAQFCLSQRFENY